MKFDDETEAHIDKIVADAPPPPPEVVAIFRPAFQRVDVDAILSELDEDYADPGVQRWGSANLDQ